MQIKFILIGLIFSSLNLHSQIVNLKDFYVGEGVIINDYEEFPFLFAGNKFKEKITININDAIEAEKFIMENFYEHRMRLLNHFGSNHNIKKLKDSKMVKRRFKHYNRQYAGYIDKQNDTIIYVGMLNFSNARKANHKFNGWNNQLLLGTGDWYYSNQDSFIYNKTKRKLEDNF